MVLGRWDVIICNCRWTDMGQRMEVRYDGGIALSIMFGRRVIIHHSLDFLAMMLSFAVFARSETKLVGICGCNCNTTNPASLGTLTGTASSSL